MRSPLPRLYAILDAEAVQRRGLDVLNTAMAFRRAGVKLLQYRDKIHQPSEILALARKVHAVFVGSGCMLILNDWPELAVEAEWDGVHVGQDDMMVEETRRIVGPERWIGLSTHNARQMQEAQATSADYLAIGPVFPTSTKTDAEAAVGLSAVRSARLLTTKPLVAIGGINRSIALSVLDSGADAVAVVSDLLSDSEAVEETTRSFLEKVRYREAGPTKTF